MPGIIDKENARLIRSHILQVSDINLEVISRLIPYPVHFENDANSAAIAELQGTDRNAVYLSLSNTVGGSVYLDNTIYLSLIHISIQFDGDGQHRPEYVASMKEKLDQGYDIVIGSRFLTAKKDWSMRMVGSRLIAAAIRLTTGARITDPTSGMRLFDRKMIEEFALNLNYGPEPDTVSFLIKQGAQVAEVPVTIDERLEGESYLRPLTAVHYMTRMLLSILFIQNFRKR